jgi:hypothetical protein
MAAMSEARGRVFEPSAAGARPGATADWHAGGLDAELDAARRAVREAVGPAYADVPHPHQASTVAWAGAELAAHRCLDLALDRLYARLGAPRPAPAALPADLAGRDAAAAATLVRLLTAPDARARYVFLEDLLAHL